MKLKRKKTVKNETETETEKYFTTEITLWPGGVFGYYPGVWTLNNGSMLSPVSNTVILQCFDVGWVTGRASDL